MTASGQPEPSKPTGHKPPSARDRTLAALHSLAKPQPKPTEVPPSSSDQIPDSASGFVGMLAKGQFGMGDAAAPSATIPTNATPGQRPVYPLRMAREIPPPASAVSTPPTPVAPPPPPPMPAPKEIPTLQRIAPQLIAFLACMLLLIGVWAVGAVVYMNVMLPKPMVANEVHYPFIRWSLDVGNFGGYTWGSRVMSWSMLACLPVGLAFLAIARALRHPAPTQQSSR